MTKFIYTSNKYPFETKYQLLINEREKVGIKTLKSPRAFTDYSQATNDVFENLKDMFDENLIVFDDMIENMESKEKF